MAASGRGRKKKLRAGEFFDVVGHKVKLKNALCHLNLEKIIVIRSVLDEVEDQLKEEMKLREMKLKKRQEIMPEVEAMLAAAGLKVEGGVITDALSEENLKSSRQKDAVDANKFFVIDSEGTHRFWSGSGHAPKPFKEAMAMGFKKEQLTAKNMVSIGKKFKEDDPKNSPYEELPNGFKTKLDKKTIAKKTKITLDRVKKKSAAKARPKAKTR